MAVSRFFAHPLRIDFLKEESCEVAAIKREKWTDEMIDSAKLCVTVQ